MQPLIQRLAHTVTQVPEDRQSEFLLAGIISAVTHGELDAHKVAAIPKKLYDDNTISSDTRDLLVGSLKRLTANIPLDDPDVDPDWRP